MFVRPSSMAKRNTSVLPLSTIIETCSKAETHPVQSYVSSIGEKKGVNICMKKIRKKNNVISCRRRRPRRRLLLLVQFHLIITND